MNEYYSLIIVTTSILYFILKIIILRGLKVKPKNPAAFLSTIYDLVFILPYLFLPFLGFDLSIESQTIFISYGFLIFILLLTTSKNIKNAKIDFNIKYVQALVITLSVFYLIGVFSNLGDADIMLNLFEIGSLANENSLNRYDDTLKVSIFYKIGVICAFAAVVLSPILLKNIKSSKDLFVSILILIIALFDSVVMGSRSGLMQLSISYIASFYVISYRDNNVKFPTYKSIFIKFSIALIFIYLYFFSIQILRGGGSLENVDGIANHVLTWFFGYLPAFSKWIDVDYSKFDYTSGSITFAGLSDLLGISERVGGMYRPITIAEGRVTNVYTAFRGLIQDFGLMFSFIFVATITKVLALCLPTPKNFFWLTYFISISIISFYLWSFVVSIWTYNSIIMGQILGVLLCYLLSNITKNK